MTQKTLSKTKMSNIGTASRQIEASDMANTHDLDNEDKAVSIVITPDHLAVIDPPLLLLQPYLEYVRRRYVPGGPSGYQPITETGCMWGLDRGRLVCAAGLVPRLADVLQHHDYEVVIHDRRVPTLRLHHDADVLHQCHGDERALLDAVTGTSQGQIEVRSFEQAINYCALIARAYPLAGIAVALPTRMQAGNAWRALERRLGERVGVAVSGAKRIGEGVHVGTYGVLPSRMNGRCDILLLPCAEQAAGNLAADMTARMTYDRVYAFVDARRRPDRHAELRLELIAGPVIYRLAPPRVKVRVVMMPTPRCTVPAYTTPLAGKRTLYWHNPTRNQHIARVARAVAAGDQGALREMGLGRRDVTALTRTSAQKKVVILVESLEHGRHLLDTLPGWALLAKATPTPATTAAPKAENTGTASTIVSAVYAAQEIVEADVLIRATGTAWPLRLRDFPPQRQQEVQDEVVVVDFMEEFDAQARYDANRRIDDYRRRGMNVVTAQT